MSCQAGKPALPPLVVDCANGVGAIVGQKLAKHLGNALEIELVNTAIDTLGALNNACGADFVKTQQKLPPSLASVLKPGQRACSLDGDADRLIYYYLDDHSQFHMLDGDKIAALVAAFIVELTKSAGLEGKIQVGIVQTAYANGGSTKYLSEVRRSKSGTYHMYSLQRSGFQSNASPQVSSTSTTPRSTMILAFISRQMGMARSYSLPRRWKPYPSTNLRHPLNRRR